MTNFLSINSKVLSKIEVPEYFNCIQYAVGNSRINSLFEGKVSAKIDYKACFVDACQEIGVIAEECSADEASKGNGHYVGLAFWYTDPDRYDYPWDYHAYRIVDREWTHKDGSHGGVCYVSPHEQFEATHCDYATFYRLVKKD